MYSENELVDARDSYFGQMRSYFFLIAKELGYEVKDMQPAFVRENRSNGSTFEVPGDGHWNELGHQLVASEIANSDVYTRTFHEPQL